MENIEIKLGRGDWKSLNCIPMVGEMKFKWKGRKRMKANDVIKIIFNKLLLQKLLIIIIIYINILILIGESKLINILW